MNLLVESVTAMTEELPKVSQDVIDDLCAAESFEEIYDLGYITKSELKNLNLQDLTSILYPKTGQLTVVRGDTSKNSVWVSFRTIHPLFKDRADWVNGLILMGKDPYMDGYSLTAENTELLGPSFYENRLRTSI